MPGLNYIKSMNLDYVTSALVTREGWGKQGAEKAAQYYRNYLTLALKYPDKTLPPSKDIDEVWHTHVLHTEQYAADCDAIFGKFMHHIPAESPPFKKGGQGGFNYVEAFQQTQALHNQEFGDYIYEIRGRFKTLASMLKKWIKE